MTKNQNTVYHELHKTLANRDHMRQSLWNAIIICNSVLIGSFTIMLSLNNKNDVMLIFTNRFLIASLIPIGFSFLNHILSYWSINKRTFLSLSYLKAKYPEDFPNEKPNEIRKFFKRINYIYKFTDTISIGGTCFVFYYFILIINELK